MQSFFKNRFKNKSFEQGVNFRTDFIHTKTSGGGRQCENHRTYLQVCYLQKKNLKFGFPSKTGRENLRTDQEVLEFKPGDIRTSTSR